MNRKTLLIMASALVFAMLLPGSSAQAQQPGSKAQAQQPPEMPYVFGMYCFMCHKQGVQIGPIGIFDMLSKTGNPLHEQYIRNTVRFGFNAMPAFRLSEVSPREMNAIVAYLKDLAAYRKVRPGYQPVPAVQGGSRK